MDFSNSLLHWYLQEKRDLPWRNTTDPYVIWLSEIILQQTRVAQGLPYFEAFVSKFPTVFDFANADEESILKLWQGLGYYSRARNMHKTAQIIAFELGGVFPTSYKELLKLKGIGPYTAAAIASFSFNEAVPVVDGNVFRVLARYFNVQTDISSSKARKEFTDLAQLLLPKSEPALFNQAIMEFGALQCVPKNPNCGKCIFAESCLALQQKLVDKLPIKLKKTKITNRFLNYLVFFDTFNNTIVSKRTEKGIWHNLYEFPLIETENDCLPAEIEKKVRMQYSDYQIDEIFLYNHSKIMHKLSHQNLTLRFYIVNLNTKIENGIQIDDLKKLPFPIAIHNFIEKYI
jgi:A/G-specific adenine glycosylase